MNLANVLRPFKTENAGSNQRQTDGIFERQTIRRKRENRNPAKTDILQFLFLLNNILRIYRSMEVLRFLDKGQQNAT